MPKILILFFAIFAIGCSASEEKHLSTSENPKKVEQQTEPIYGYWTQIEDVYSDSEGGYLFFQDGTFITTEFGLQSSYYSTINPIGSIGFWRINDGMVEIRLLGTLLGVDLINSDFDSTQKLRINNYKEYEFKLIDDPLWNRI